MYYNSIIINFVKSVEQFFLSIKFNYCKGILRLFYKENIGNCGNRLKFVTLNMTISFLLFFS